jgi:hypothetical protein
MRTLLAAALILTVAACGEQAQAPAVARTATPVAFAQPPLRAVAPAPTASSVCLEDPDAALAARLQLDGEWAVDPVAGQMAHRGLVVPPGAVSSGAPAPPKLKRIVTHSPATLRAGLARYLTPQGQTPGVKTAALITYAGVGESCAWLMSADGVVAYGRSSIDEAQVRADVSEVLRILDVQGAMNARAPRLRSAPESPPQTPAPLDQGALATALAHVAESVTPSLVAEALVDFESVIVVPHQGLLAFPMLLLTRGRAEGKPGFLIDTMSIQIAPSLSEIGIGPGLHRDVETELASMSPQARLAALSAALIVGNPAFADSEYAMPPLPGAAEEAQAVGAVLGAAPVIGEAADVATVRSRLQAHPRYVHFATHGISDGDGVTVASNRGFVALANGGRFTLADARATRMADGAIVVLSACQSGLGASRPGGVIGLPRAFQLAGAQTVVMSSWNVDDAATADLMAGFARNLVETGRPATAFAAAVRDTRARFPDPRHWAAFGVFGVARP